MKRITLFLGVVIIALLITLGWWRYSLQPVNNDKSAQRFVIAKGDGVREISRKLHDAHLIRHQIAFFLLVKKLGIEKNIQAGSYKLSPSMTAEQLANKLTVGTEDVWITIPEGWRQEQIVEYLRKNDFSEGTRLSDNKFDPDEGRYFPDTYLTPKTASIDQVLGLMRKNFDKKVTFPVSNDQLIVASMVEREGKTDSDRPVIASVIYNRLKSGIALNIDATLQYAIGYTHADGWWKKELTEADKKFQSPYNTYQNPGLPPGPISNPGLAALKAATNPPETKYLYYLHDKSGAAHFAKSLEEHNQNIANFLK